MEKIMRKEMEEIREKVHTTADAALFLCFQELNGSHSKGVIRLPLLHYDVPFAGYGEMLLWMNRIYDLLGMPDAGSCMRSLREEEKGRMGIYGGYEKPAGDHASGRNRADGQHSDSVPPALQSAGISDLRKAESRFPFGAGAFVSARRLSAGAGCLKTGEDVE